MACKDSYCPGCGDDNIVLVEGVRLSPASLTIKYGMRCNDIKASVVPGNASNPYVLWSSSNTRVAPVDMRTGQVFGAAPGTATIYATSASGRGYHGSCNVTVTVPNPVTGVKISEETVNLQVGKVRGLTASVLPANATYTSVVWRSEDSSVATVEECSGTAYVTAKKTGQTVISVSTLDGNKTAECIVTVTRRLIDKIEIRPAQKTMIIGESVYLEAIAYKNGERLCCTDFDWDTADSSVVSVNKVTGRVEARGVGSTTVFAAAQDGSGQRGSCTVTVIPKVPVTGFDMCNDTRLMYVGSPGFLPVSVHPINATDKTIMWTSSDPYVATVEPYSGWIRPTHSGITTITATTRDGGFQSSAVIKVTHKITYPDTLIEDCGVKEGIINLKSFADQSDIEYLKGNITACERDKVFEEVEYQMNLLRADYIGIQDNIFSDYAYAVLGGNKDEKDPWPFGSIPYYEESNPISSLGIMVIQRTMMVDGTFEPEDDNYHFGTWDDVTNEALNNANLTFWGRPYASVTEPKNSFTKGSFYLLYNEETIKNRSKYAYGMLRLFNLQHIFVQNQCVLDLTVAGYSPATKEVRVYYSPKTDKNGNTVTGKYGRADVVASNPTGSYIWEVKHNTPLAVATGSVQVANYVYEANTHAPQNVLTNHGHYGPYKLGLGVFGPRAYEWGNKFLLVKSCPENGALITYELSDNVPDGYELVVGKAPCVLVEPAPGTFKKYINIAVDAVCDAVDSVISATKIFFDSMAENLAAAFEIDGEKMIAPFAFVLLLILVVVVFKVPVPA